MKRIVFLVVAAAVLAYGADAFSLVKPQGRKSNGDPDEFQARQVLDEGIMVAGPLLDTCGKSGGEQPPTVARSGRSAKRFEARPLKEPARISITFSGRIIFLER